MHSRQPHHSGIGIGMVDLQGVPCEPCACGLLSQLGFIIISLPLIPDAVGHMQKSITRIKSLVCRCFINNNPLMQCNLCFLLPPPCTAPSASGVCSNQMSDVWPSLDTAT